MEEDLKLEPMTFGPLAQFLPTTSPEPLTARLRCVYKECVDSSETKASDPVPISSSEKAGSG